MQLPVSAKVEDPEKKLRNIVLRIFGLIIHCKNNFIGEIGSITVPMIGFTFSFTSYLMSNGRNAIRREIHSQLVP